MLKKWLWCSVSKLRGVFLYPPPSKLYKNIFMYVQILEVNKDKATVIEPMTKSIAAEFLMRKYQDQPLSYFNQDKRIFIINCETGTVKPASLTFEL